LICKNSEPWVSRDTVSGSEGFSTSGENLGFIRIGID